MDFRKRLLRFYEAHCPEKCMDVDNLVVKYGTREKDLFRQLTFKYGPEPKLSDAEKTAIRKRTCVHNQIQKTQPQLITTHT